MRDINRMLTEVHGELFVPRSLESDERFLCSHRLGEQGHKQAKGTHLWGTRCVQAVQVFAFRVYPARYREKG